ncbi:MAG TPA: hypothetical protein VM580_30405, partial [Labilithrix sp.]|nr:hypothetical protein [Labilithrix sp.]
GTPTISPPALAAPVTNSTVAPAAAAPRAASSPAGELACIRRNDLAPFEIATARYTLTRDGAVAVVAKGGQAALFDPTCATWTPLPSVEEAGFTSLVELASGDLLLAGGAMTWSARLPKGASAWSEVPHERWKNGQDRHTGVLFATSEGAIWLDDSILLLDTKQTRWKTQRSLGKARVYDQTAIQLSSDRIVVLGGICRPSLLTRKQVRSRKQLRSLPSSSPESSYETGASSSSRMAKRPGSIRRPWPSARRRAFRSPMHSSRP